MKYLLDTHTWIWWNSNPSNLSNKVKELIEDLKNYEELLLSVISIWEFSKLLEKGRLKISVNGYTWIEQALILPKLKVCELTPQTAFNSTTLPQPIHDDPADQILIATARIENAVIITKDQLIQNYPHVKTIW